MKDKTMKTKRINLKLSLNKTTVASLQNPQMEDVKGGKYNTINYSCDTVCADCSRVGTCTCQTCPGYNSCNTYSCDYTCPGLNTCGGFECPTGTC